MNTLDTTTFLTLEGNPISVGQAFSCLQLFGRLQPFVQEFLRYYTVYKEIQSCDDLIVTSAEVSQVIMDFRLRVNLTDPEQFRIWLTGQGLDYAAFESQTIISLKLEKLKDKLVKSEAENFFETNSASFDQIEISYAAIADADLAQQLKDQIATGTTFEQIARDYPLNAEQKVVVKRDILRRQQLREEIKAVVQTAKPGELLGPIPMGNRWCILRLEQLLPAALDDAIRQELRDLLFNQWLAKKLQNLKQGGNTQAADQSELAESQPTALEMAEAVASHG